MPNQNITGQSGSDANYKNLNVQNVLTAGRIVTQELTASVIAGSLRSTGVTPGTYTFATVTIGSDGRITSASDGIVPAPPPTPPPIAGGITCSNPPTVADTVPLWTDTSGNLVRQQQSASAADLARFAGPVTSRGPSTVDTNVCFGATATPVATDVAGGALTTGARNVFLGAGAGTNVTDRNEGVIIGYRAGRNVGGHDNVIVGSDAATNGNVQSENVVIGSSACRNLAGVQNIVIGGRAAENLVDGQANIFIGIQRGGGFVGPGQSNIFIGNTQSVGGADVSNNILIGQNVTTDGKNENIVIGNNSGTTGTGGNSNTLVLNVSSADNISATASNQMSIMLSGTNFFRSSFLTQTTVGAAAGPTPLPGNPIGFLRCFIGGFAQELVIPFWNRL